ncbi:MAG: hypothetical protein BMS9Abin26_1225 [Gammaproteobacteria bacterium]|nr:MAG: hypothetical protein BMS9Abin26_1225 [Gammaproteobacteria bacterium]
MQINLPQNLQAALLASASSRSVESLINSLQQSQLLQATVVKITAVPILSDSPGQATNLTQSYVQLRIQGQILQTRTDAPLNTGQQLTVRLTQENGQPILRIINPLPTPSAQTTPPQTLTAEQALRVALPRQAPLPPLLSNISVIALSPDKLPMVLPQTLIDTARQLFNQIATAKDIRSANGLKTALQNSGLFLENKLAKQITGQQVASTRSDLKAGLNRLLNNLLNQVRQTPVQAVTSVTKNTYTTPPQATTPGQSSKLVQDVVRALETSSKVYTETSKTTAVPRSAVNPLTAGSASTTAQNPDVKTAASTESKSAVPGKAEEVAIKTESSQPGRARPVVNPARAAAPTILETDSNQRAIGELTRQTQSGLARVQMHQLNAMATEDTSVRPGMTIELPVRLGNRVDVFEFRVKDETRDSDADSESRLWRMVLSFDLESLGPVTAMITMVDKQISTELWAEQATTAELFDKHLNELRSEMTRAGVLLGTLRCRTGIPPSNDPGEDNDRLLLDLKA